MKFIQITTIYGETLEVNLNNISTYKKLMDENIELNLGGYYVNISKEEFERVKKEFEHVEEDSTNKIKNIIYDAHYLDAETKLKLLKDLGIL